MKDVPNVCITVNKPSGGIPDRYTICELEGSWILTVEHWRLRPDSNAYEHHIVYLGAYTDLPLALAGLKETGYVYGSDEVVEYAESLIKVIRN